MTAVYQALAESTLDWWQLAGVSECYADAATNWFDLPEPVTAITPAAPHAAPHAASKPQAIVPNAQDTSAAPPRPARPAPQYGRPWSRPDGPPPANHADFIAWLMTAPELALPSGNGTRIAPHGVLNPRLMVIADKPDGDDRDRLFSGAGGALLRRILSAACYKWEDCYFAAILSETPLAGALPADQTSYFAAVMRQHITLVAPQTVVLLGDFTNSALTSHNLTHNQRQLRFVNQDSGNIPATASFHPRILLQNPELKRQAWTDWQRIMGNLN